MADACGLREELECQRPVREGPGQIRVELETGSWRGSEVWLQPGGEAGRHVLGFAGGGAGAGPSSRGGARAPGCPPPPSLPGPQVLGLCGAAYRPTEEIDLRSVGWGNIFQLPFKHVRDFRLRHLVPFFIYSGFEVLFACTGLALVSAACRG